MWTPVSRFRRLTGRRSFVRQIADSYQLCTMNMDGSGIAQITHDPWNHDTAYVVTGREESRIRVGPEQTCL